MSILVTISSFTFSFNILFHPTPPWCPFLFLFLSLNLHLSPLLVYTLLFSPPFCPIHQVPIPINPSILYVLKLSIPWDNTIHLLFLYWRYPTYLSLLPHLSHPTATHLCSLLIVPSQCCPYLLCVPISPAFVALLPCYCSSLNATLHICYSCLTLPTLPQLLFVSCHPTVSLLAFPPLLWISLSSITLCPSSPPRVSLPVHWADGWRRSGREGYPSRLTAG